jgi:hypothetical protein
VKYLTADKTMSSCFRDYLAQQQIQKKHIVSFSTFRKYVLSNMDIQFKRPRTDTCQQCDKLTKNIKYCKSDRQKAVFREQLDVHLKKADIHYASVNYDRNVLAVRAAVNQDWLVPDTWSGS